MSTYCSACGAPMGEREPRCPTCGQNGASLVARSRDPGLPVLPTLPLVQVVPVVPVVRARYEGGSHGVRAEVTVPEGDVEIMNQLGSLVSLLHVLAARVAKFGIMTDHTRKLVRDMRILATDAQEEVEMRRGPA